jgi:alkanesulfonate monooxygenase SsuD/methylene tetrahydromethanopterin reductase-like flavin-dependent oxidoreductase (luciferase family)
MSDGTGFQSHSEIHCSARRVHCYDLVAVRPPAVPLEAETSDGGIWNADLLSALAEATQKVELGTLASNFRNPALLAKWQSPDEISQGG